MSPKQFTILPSEIPDLEEENIREAQGSYGFKTPSVGLSTTMAAIPEESINPRGNLPSTTTYMPNSSITPSRFSTGSNATISSQVLRRNVKVSITDYPKYDGDPEKWEEFATRFLAVASSQGFDYIFQEPEFTPKTIQDKETYECDLAFIFDSFNNAWVEKDN